jgi:hypothetical protein
MRENLVPEEQELADALQLIANKYGKFNDDNTGIWAGYTPASENLETAKIGVKCGNCVFFSAPNGCSIIASEVEEGGLCRFAVLPDGAVNASGGSGAPAELLDMRKIKKGVGPVTLSTNIVADADYGDACPPATQDIVLNIENRQNAIDAVGYGPLNPDEANTEFWQDKADRWKITPVEASKSICGNCVFFDRRPKTLDCIETGIAEGGSGDESAWGAIDQAELGYCTALDFKCAASRTCNAWAAGGPITEDVVTSGGQYQVGDDIDVDVSEFFMQPVYSIPEGLKEYADEADEDYEYDFELDDLIPTQRTVNMIRVKDAMGSDKPIKVWIDEDGEPEIINGHHRSVAHRLDGKSQIRAKVYEIHGFTATAGSKPAPKKDRIKGSKKNAKGSAASGKGVTFTAAITKSLEKKVADHNEKAPNGRKVTLAKLKAVYRRGAGAFSTSHRPDQNRNSWAMARVNAFLHLVKTGKPKNKKYVTDNDLLPKMHPRSTTASGMSPLMASIVASLNTPSDEPETDSNLEPWLE